MRQLLAQVRPASCVAWRWWAGAVRVVCCATPSPCGSQNKIACDIGRLRLFLKCPLRGRPENLVMVWRNPDNLALGVVVSDGLVGLMHGTLRPPLVRTIQRPLPPARLMSGASRRRLVGNRTSQWRRLSPSQPIQAYGSQS